MTAPATPPQHPGSKDPEQAESVDLEHVRHALEAALAALLLLWLAIRVSWIKNLVEQIREAGRRRGGGRDFPGITVDKAESGQATETVTDALVRYAKQAAQHVVDEAALQGHTIDPGEVSPAALEDQAAVAVALLADSLELSAASEAARVHPPEAVIVEQGKDAATAAHPDGKSSAEDVKKAIDTAREAAANDTASKVEQHLHELTDAQLRYVLGAVLHGAGNEARIATFLGSRDVDLFASEVLDVNTCLAPEVLVTTDRGAVRADEVQLDDKLLTHAGRWVQPSHIVISEVTEALVVLELSDGRALRLTEDHPVLSVDGGRLEWLDAGKLAMGSFVIEESTLEHTAEVRVPDFGFRQSPHRVAPILDVGSLPAVNVRPKGMPVGSVGLNDQMSADEEVDRPRADTGLRRVLEVQSLKCLADDSFDAGLGATCHVAPHRAVPTLPREARHDPKTGRTVSANDNDGRPATGLAAVDAVLGLTVPEGTSAPTTDTVTAAGSQRARTRAVGVPRPVRCWHGELASAVRTDLGDAVADPADLREELRIGVLTASRAVDSASPVMAGDLRRADLAVAGRELSSPPLDRGVPLATDPFDDRHTAVNTRSIHLLSVVEVRRETYAGRVYDFTVPGDETFWAQGVLVHNCGPCFDVHGTLLARVGSGDYTLLRRLYPVRGYIDCLGRDRCRGTVVGIWRDRKVSE